MAKPANTVTKMIRVFRFIRESPLLPADRASLSRACLVVGFARHACLSARSRTGRGRGGGNSLSIDQDFHATVLAPPLSVGVVRQRGAFAVRHGEHTQRIHLFLSDQI